MDGCAKEVLVSLVRGEWFEKVLFCTYRNFIVVMKFICDRSEVNVVVAYAPYNDKEVVKDTI